MLSPAPTPSGCSARILTLARYQLISQVADHVHWATGESWTDVRHGVTDRTSAAGGGHAHTGLMIYQGDNWPAEYRGQLFTLNFHGRRLNCDTLVPKSVGYTATHGQDICQIADPWFRGMDVIGGADGGVFLPIGRTQANVMKSTACTVRRDEFTNLHTVTRVAIRKSI